MTNSSALRVVMRRAAYLVDDIVLMCTGRKTRCKISVIMLARRVMVQPKLRRKLRDPWRCLYDLRRQVIDAF